MTPEQVDLVQSSFQKVVPFAGRLAEAFYTRLFEIAPDTRRLFTANLDQQRKKLVQMLVWLVTNLKRIETIHPAIQELGLRHLRYEVKADDFDQVGAALIYALQETLGERFTPEVRQAWITVYGVVMKMMKDAAKAPMTSGMMSPDMLDGSLIAVYGALDATQAIGENENQGGTEKIHPEKRNKIGTILDGR